MGDRFPFIVVEGKGHPLVAGSGWGEEVVASSSAAEIGILRSGLYISCTRVAPAIIDTNEMASACKFIVLGMITIQKPQKSKCHKLQGKPPA